MSSNKKTALLWLLGGLCFCLSAGINLALKNYWLAAIQIFDVILEIALFFHYISEWEKEIKQKNF